MKDKLGLESFQSPPFRITKPLKWSFWEFQNRVTKPKCVFFVKKTTALTYRNIEETHLLFKRLLSAPLELQRTLLKYKDFKTYKTDYWLLQIGRTWDIWIRIRYTNHVNTWISLGENTWQKWQCLLLLKLGLLLNPRNCT